MATPHGRFSIRMFLLQVAPQALILVGIYELSNPGFWMRQLAMGFGLLIVVFLIAELGLCFFEWWFHRYVLHCTMHPVLVRFSRGHRHHHALTPIGLGEPAGEKTWFVLNRYPIEDVEQYEDAAFPPYAVSAFWALFTIPLLWLQWLLPTVPIMLGGYAAILCSMIGYEVFHAIEHYPYEWWERAVQPPPNASSWQKFQARIWKKIYGFHHFHHANIKANEAISGFFGLPVADWLLRTYHQPKDLLLKDRIATARDFKVQDPWPLVVWFDNWAKRRESSIRHLRQ